MSLTSAVDGVWPLYPRERDPEPTMDEASRSQSRCGRGAEKSRLNMYVFAYWPYIKTIPSEEKRNIRKVTYSQIKIYMPIKM